MGKACTATAEREKYRPGSPMKQVQHTLTVQTKAKGIREITHEIVDWVADQGIETGMLTVFCRHTTASLTIQENADDDVQRDLETFYDAIAPEDPNRYRHRPEGPDDMPAHIRGSLLDSSLNIPVRGGRPGLGRWQGIYLFEHRTRPRPREIILHLSGV